MKYARHCNSKLSYFFFVFVSVSFFIQNALFSLFLLIQIKTINFQPLSIRIVWAKTANPAYLCTLHIHWKCIWQIICENEKNWKVERKRRKAVPKTSLYYRIMRFKKFRVEMWKSRFSYFNRQSKEENTYRVHCICVSLYIASNQTVSWKNFSLIRYGVCGFCLFFFDFFVRTHKHGHTLTLLNKRKRCHLVEYFRCEKIVTTRLNRKKKIE